MEEEDNDFLLPIMAYYGTGRGNIVFSKRRRDFRKVFKRWDSYEKALDPAVDFKSCFEHFDYWEDEERRTWKKYGVDYKSPTLEIIRKVFKKCVKGYDNPRTELQPLRFVMDELLPDGKKREMRIEQMSDGFKIMVAMINDIASRMIDVNPNATDPLQTPGLVLVDEIDLHLRPEWQRKVLRELSECFPNVQFIVTTHSPIVALGASDFAQIITLNDEEQVSNGTLSDISNYDISEVLLSSLFGLKSAYSPKWDEIFAEQSAILKKTELTDEDEKKLDMLDQELEALGYVHTSSAIRSAEISKLIDKLKL